MVNKTNRSYLSNLKIAGYKSIASNDLAQTISLKNVNIIIGANGAGKSNFVSFFKMLNNIMTGALQLFVGKNGTAENILFFGSKKTPLLSAKLEFANEQNKDIYEFSLVKSVQDSLIFSEEKIKWNDKEFVLGGGQKESVLFTSEQLNSAQRIIKTILSSCKAFQFNDTSDTSHIRNSSEINNNKFLFSDAGNIASILYLLKNKKEYLNYYKRIVDYVRFVVPQFDDFELEPNPLNPEYIKLRWRQKGELEYILGPEQLSDGSIRFIALATLFLQPPSLLPNVIIIDEPELGLHPQAVDILATLIKTAAQHSQVIAATQSERLIDSFNSDDILVVEYDKKNNCSFFKRLDSKELSGWLKDYSLSQLWEKNILGGQP